MTAPTLSSFAQSTLNTLIGLAATAAVTVSVVAYQTQEKAVLTLLIVEKNAAEIGKLREKVASLEYHCKKPDR